jgi:hypothetical protein
MNRSVALGAAWSASAVAAVGLGFLAVSLVDASASPGTSPAGATSTASTTPSAPSGTSAPPATGDHITVAGTVFADCTSGSPVLAGAPAAGWWADDSNDPGEFEFESATQKLEVHVSCVDGGPVFSDEGVRDDDDGGRGRDDGTPTAVPAPSATDAPDDSDGRIGGGHGSDDDSGAGSDDSGGDDSSGRGGSGSGSDDD